MFFVLKEKKKKSQKRRKKVPSGLCLGLPSEGKISSFDKILRAVYIFFYALTLKFLSCHLIMLFSKLDRYSVHPRQITKRAAGMSTVVKGGNSIYMYKM